MIDSAVDGVRVGYADGSKDFGYIVVDAANAKEVAQAFWLFENLDFGMPLPDAWVNPFPSGDGFKWDVAGAPVPRNGHCVCGIDLAPGGVLIDSWGLEGVLTFEAIAEYANANCGGTVIVHLSQDQLAKGMAKAPNGLDWNKIVSYFQALGGSVALPATVKKPWWAFWR